MALLLPPPQPDVLIIFIGGLAAGWAVALVMLAPILAKGLDAHHHLPPSRRRRQRMILGYCGMAAAALCLAVYALTYSTPLYSSPLRLILLIIGLVLNFIFMFALGSARDIREPELLTAQRDAPDGSGSPGVNSPPAP